MAASKGAMSTVSGKPHRQQPWDWVSEVHQGLGELPMDPEPSVHKPSDIMERMTAPLMARRTQIYQEMTIKIESAVGDLNEKAVHCVAKMKDALRPLQQDMNTLSEFTQADLTPETEWHEIAHMMMEVQENFQRQREIISKGTDHLESLETDRAARVKPHVEEAVERLERHATIVAGDAEHLIADEVQKFNEIILNNRTAIADMRYTLSHDTADGEKMLMFKIIDVQARWRSFMAEQLVKDFKDYLRAVKAEDPPFLRQLLEYLVDGQKQIMAERQDLLRDLQLFLPPDCTYKVAGEFQEKMLHYCKEYENIQHQFFASYDIEANAVLNEITVKLHTLKKEIVEHKYCTQEQVNEMLPDVAHNYFVDAERSRLDVLKAKMQKVFPPAVGKEVGFVKQVFDLLSGVSKVWDAGQALLQKKESEYKANVGGVQAKYQAEVEALEEEMIIASEVLRQSSTAEDIPTNFDNVKKVFDKADEKFAAFKVKMQREVRTYPVCLMTMVSTYQKALFGYFKLWGEDTLAPVIEKAARDSALATEEAKATGAGKGSRVTGKRGALPAATRRAEKAKSKARNEPPDLSGYTPIIVSFSGGKRTVYELKPPCQPELNSKPGGKSPRKPAGKASTTSTSTPLRNRPDTKTSTLFLTETKVESDGLIKASQLTEHMVAEYDLEKLRLRIRKALLADWAELEPRFRKHTGDCIAEKLKGLDVETQLRTGVLEQRMSTIQRNVINARLNELKQHEERLDLHVSSTETALDDAKASLSKAFADLLREASEAVSIMPPFHARLRHQTSLAKIRVVKEEAKVLFREYNLKIDLKSIELRDLIDTIYQKILDANRDLVTAAKSFKEGGHHSSDELTQCKVATAALEKRLGKDKLASEEEYAAVVPRLAMVQYEIVREFEDQYHCHYFDTEFKLDKAKVNRDGQSKIYGEVEKSNQDSRDIMDALVRLPDDDAIEDFDTLLCEISAISKMLLERATYLGCLKEAKPAVTKAKKAKAPLKKKSLQPQSRFGPQISQAQDDKRVDHLSAISVTRQILNRQSPPPPVTGRPHLARQQPQAATATKVDDSDDFLDDVEEEATSGTAQEGSLGGRATRSRVYRKMPSFCGEVPDKQTTNRQFASGVRAALHECRREMIQLAEPYYGAIGQREPCYPDDIPDTVQELMATVDETLHDYYRQSVKFRKDSREEYEKQLGVFIKKACHLSPLVLRKHHAAALTALHTATAGFEQSHKESVSLSELDREMLRDAVTPDMCEPGKQNALSELDAKEAQRSEKAMVTAEQLMKDFKGQISTVSAEYIRNMTVLYDTSLARMDTVVSFADVLPLHPVKVEKNIADFLGMVGGPPTGKAGKEKSEDTAQGIAPQPWPHSIGNDRFMAMFPELFAQEITQRSGGTRAGSRRKPPKTPVTKPDNPDNHVQQAMAKTRDEIANVFAVEVLKVMEGGTGQFEQRRRDILKWRKHWRSSVEALQGLLDNTR